MNITHKAPTSLL